MTIARDAVAFRVSFFWQLQVMPPQNVVQHRLIDLRIRHELLDPGQILVSANARSDGNDMFGTEYFCRNAFIIRLVLLRARLLRLIRTRRGIALGNL